MKTSLPFVLSGALLIGAGGIYAFLMVSGGSLPEKAGPTSNPGIASTRPITNGGRTIYPYSVVPGGVLSSKELNSRPDSYARKFYGNIDYRTAVMWRSYGGSYYNSYRVGNQIYQKTKRTPLRVGELLVKVQRTSGEPVFIKARCGNLLLDKITAPTEAEARQPSDKVLGDDGPMNALPPDPRFLSMLDKSLSLPDFGPLNNIPHSLDNPDTDNPSSDEEQERALVDNRHAAPAGAFYGGGGFYGGGFAGGGAFGNGGGNGNHGNNGGAGNGSGGGIPTPPPDGGTPPVTHDNPPPATVTPEPSVFLYVVIAGGLLMGLRKIKMLSRR